MWFLWTVVVAGLWLSGMHLVAACAPASWSKPDQGPQPPMDFVLHAQQMHRLKQELWPHCQRLLDADTQRPPATHLEEQDLAICQEVDSLLAGLQSSWHALHQHSQACSVLGLTPGIPPCSPDTPPSMPMSSQPHNPQLPFSPKSTHQQRQQASIQHDCMHPGAISTDGVSCSNKSPTAERHPASKAVHASTQTEEASQPLLFPGSILTHPSEQQQRQTGHNSWPAQQHLGPVDQLASPDELLVLPQDATEESEPGSWLWGGVLLNAQKLWRELIYDTQVVQKQLENEARIGGQACRSCLVPHLHKSHREVVAEVVALLVLFALCASGLFVAATFYRRRQSTRRQAQHNIATQRQRHFEKLQQQQQQQQQLQQRQRQLEAEGQSVEEPGRPAPLPLLQSQPPSPAVTAKHARHRFKSSESTIPSSPSASSSRSEAIGTQVRSHSKPNKAEEPKRARSAQRSAVNLGPVDSLVYGLGRSQSDLSREAAQHGPFEMPQRSRHSMQCAEGPVQEPPGSAPSTPSSMAGSTTFNPFRQAPSGHQTLPTGSDSSKAASATSVDGSQHAKQAGSKRRNRHKGKVAKKTPPAKRRFIPGLDSEFDPAIHELPTPPQDPNTDSVRQRGAVQSLGCSSPSSSSSALPDFQTRRQLSVDAPIFVPNSYSNMSNFTCGASQYPFSQQPEWQPQSAGCHADALCQMLRTADSALPDPLFNPRLTQTPTFPFSTYLTRVSPNGHPMYQEERVAPTPRPAVPVLSSQTSPTSVLPAGLPSSSGVGNPILSSMICSSSYTSAPFATAGEQQPQLGFVGSPRGWGLPPLLEEGLGSPFPGMPCRTSERPFHTTAGNPSPIANIFSAPMSAGQTLAEQPHVSSLPGFNSIWKSSDTHSSDSAWHSFTADRNAIW